MAEKRVFVNETGREAENFRGPLDKLSQGGS
jgi:hypothetical protein